MNRLSKPNQSIKTPASIWFKQHGWIPFPFQSKVWSAVASEESGLLHATTGSGKTYAIWLAAINKYSFLHQNDSQIDLEKTASKKTSNKASLNTPPLTVLWITPMRALAADTERALKLPLDELNINWTVSIRTGDTSATERARQSKKLPTALITTPESLSLLLTRIDAKDTFKHLEMVVVDEWHELIGNKRGVQLQLALARLRMWRPKLLTWGLSATLGNLSHALEVLIPEGNGQLIQGEISKSLVIDTLLPERIDRFPWAGHLGLRMLPQVVEQLEISATTLLFTNTRSQAELWYLALLEARPDWAGLIALHHGSLDRSVREWVELALKEGRLKGVICTSSLDLGVDFLPVERVLQIGSPKGVARLMQRAGRSGHAPGRVSRLTMVPTNSLEILESIAAQDAIAVKKIEPRQSPHKPLDVLVQHLVTIALGGGFIPNELHAEIKTAYAYHDITLQEWQWVLSFVEHGGGSLGAYPDYHRAIPDLLGIYHVPDARLAMRHRMSIGTIVSDASIAVKFWRKRGAKSLGTVEESFVARIKPGDHFLFGGRSLELVRVHEMTAYVLPSKGKKPAVPRWNGGRMPLSNELSDAIVARMDAASNNEFVGPEMEKIKPMLELQKLWSALPTLTTLLAEVFHSREGWHLFLYPYAGRNVHLGLASLLAWRFSKHQPNTFSIAVNDYGFELLSPTEIDWANYLNNELFSTDNLLIDVMESLNASELAQRKFREIARISGLVFSGYPGAPKSAKQIQASSSLFYDVFRKYDPKNLLLSQSEYEVLSQELDIERLQNTLLKLQSRELNLQLIERPTPFAFPLLVERFRESLTSEKLADRISRMVTDLEKAGGNNDFRIVEVLFEKNSSKDDSLKNRGRIRKEGKPSDKISGTKRIKSGHQTISRPRSRHGF